MSDYTMEELYSLLEKRKRKIGEINNIIQHSREKIKKIHKKIDKQEEKLLELLVKITNVELPISSLDRKNTTSEQITNEINIILNNMRMIRLDLADIIRK